MNELVALEPTRLVIAALVGLAVLLALIIRFKVPAMIAILVGAVLIGLGAGMPLDQIVKAVDDGVGNTLKGIALLVGLGSMFGAILEISGGAKVMAVTLVDRFGERKAAWALAITGLVIAIPVFFDAGLIILIPLAFSLARRTGRSTLYYAIPLLAGLAVGHAFIPPTPGPVLVAAMLGVDLGRVILVGAACGVAAMIVAGPLWGAYCGRKFFVAAPGREAGKESEERAEAAEPEAGRGLKAAPARRLPSFATVLTIILIPLILIILKSVAGVVDALAPARKVISFLGEPFVALTIATVVAMVLLGRRNGYSAAELEKVMTKSLEPVGLILLVTACGGVLRYILQYSGLGEVIGQAVASAALPMVIVAFVVAAVVRISVGSATVAMTMAAGIVAAMPEVGGLPPAHLACITAAIAGGATVCSHFNDSGFWLVKTLLGMDEKTTLRTWTVMETLVGFTGFLVALVISFFV
jgi:GntP family gluconate:H+ symporter/Gnt-I system low-affinity gluconate transporter